MTDPAEIISDEEIAKVHGHANFGNISPREVVNDGVRKYAVGFQSGYTQLTILREHGLITTPKPGSYAANLTKKGKKYARALFHERKELLAENAALRASDAEQAAITEQQNALIRKLTGQRDEARAVIKDVDQAARQAASMDEAGYSVTVQRTATHIYGITAAFLWPPHAADHVSDARQMVPEREGA